MRRRWMDEGKAKFYKLSRPSIVLKSDWKSIARNRFYEGNKRIKNRNQIKSNCFSKFYFYLQKDLNKNENKFVNQHKFKKKIRIIDG